MNIDEMRAGLELDALVGKHVLGLDVLGTVLVNRDYTCCSRLDIPMDGKPRPGAFERPVYLKDCFCDQEDEDQEDLADYFGHTFLCLEVVHRYSVDYSAGWTVVEELQKLKPEWMMIITTYGHDGRCYIQFELMSGEGRQAWLHTGGATFPLAACRISLKAIDYDAE